MGVGEKLRGGGPTGRGAEVQKLVEVEKRARKRIRKKGKKRVLESKKGETHEIKKKQDENTRPKKKRRGGASWSLHHGNRGKFKQN